MKKGDNVRLRSDGRYEARYIKERDSDGKIKYGYCYGKTYDEAIEKREFQLQKQAVPREMNLLILGAGSHGNDVFEIARGLHVFAKVAYLDDNITNERVIGKWNDSEKLTDDYPIAIVAVGDEDIRRNWTERLITQGFIIPTLVHPTAFISEGVEVGVGTVVCARATIASGVTIGKGCIISSGATVPRKTHIPSWRYFDIDRIIQYKTMNNKEEE